MYPRISRVAYRLPARLSLCLLVAAGAGCRTPGSGGTAPLVQPGAPGQATRVISAEKATDLSRVQYTPADVRFMQGMIGHHAQALEMTALLPERSRSDDLRLLARRIEVSQADEIAMMRGWLEVRGQQVPGPHAHHAPGAPLMPGMLTAEEMAGWPAPEATPSIGCSSSSMIKHHEGALTMVKELFRRPAPVRNPRFSRSRPTSTPISAWRSTGCRECCMPATSKELER